MNSSPTETEQSRAARRRIWPYPAVQSHSLIALTHEHLYALPEPRPPRPGVMEAIQAGDDPKDILGAGAEIIELAAVEHVKLDMLTNSVKLHFSHAAAGRRQMKLIFSTPAMADSFFTKLWRRLGSGVQLQPYKQDTWSAARAPLLMLAGVLLATAAVVLFLSMIEDAVQPAPLGGISWKWVCGYGGAAAAIAQVWLYRRLTRPPVILELTRIQQPFTARMASGVA